MIDTSAIVSVLISSEKADQATRIFEFIGDEDLVTIQNVLEEAAYIGLSAINGCRGFKLRDEVKTD